MAVNPVLRQLVADGKATKNAQSGTQTKMTAAKSAAQSTPMRRSLSNQQKTTSGTKNTDALTSAIISTNQKAAQKKTNTAERGSKHYTNRANQQRRAQAQVVANQIKKNNAERANKYSLGKGVAGAVAKGVNQAAQGVASTLALAEDVALAPFELFSGQKLGDLSDTAPLNKLSQRIKNEGQETQKKYADNVAKGGKAAALLDKYGAATVAAVPQAVMAYLTAGASAGASTAGLGAQAAAEMTPSMAGTIRRGVTAMAKDPNYWTAFSQVVGQSYDEAMDDMAKTGTENNKARTKAALYAMGNGLFNAAVEVGGGIQKLPEELKHGANAWKAWVDSAVDEGKEEAVQGVIERALQNGVYHKGNKLASLSDGDAILNPRTAAEEFAGGAVVGGVLGGGQIGVNAMLNAMNGRGKGAETPDIDAGARQAMSEGNFTPAQENAAEGAQGASATDGQGNGLVGTMRNSLSVLRDEKPVARITGTEIPVGGKIVERLQAFANSFGNKVNRPGFGDVLFSKSRIKNSMIGHGIGQAKIDAFAAVPDVIRSGQEIAHETNWKGRNYDTYIFAAPIDYKGATDYLGVIVTKDSASNRYYVHEVVDANGNVLFESKEAPSPASDGTSALSGDLDHVASGDASTDTAPRTNQTSLAADGGAGVQAPVSLDPTVTQGNSGVKGEDMQRGGNYAPENHIDNRTAESVAPRSVNAFSFDHPELRGYYVEAAEQIAGVAELSRMYGQQMGPRERTAEGYKRASNIYETPALRAAMDEGLSRSQIIDAADRLIKDHGQENVKAAKTLELILDDMLTNGYTNVAGEQVGPNAAYLAAKAQIDGAQPAQARQAEELPIWDMDVPDDGLGAADAGFDPFTAAQNAYGTLPSGEKPVRPDDAPRSTNGEDRVSQTVVTAKGAQVTPDEFVPLIENETMKGGFSFIPVSNNDVTQRATARIAEKGWSRALADWTSDVRAGKAGDSITATGALLYNYAVNSGDTGLALSVLSDYATAVRNSARGLQAARIMKTLTPSNRLYMMEQNIRNLAERLGITDGLHLDKELAQQYLDAQDDAARDKIIEDIQQDVADQIPSTLLDKWTAWRYVNMLGNFKTQGRNIVGNVGMQVVQRAKDGIATALESIAYHASGGKFERTKSFTVDKALRDAAKADFKNVQTVALGEGKYHEGGDSDAFLRGVEDKRTIFKNNGDWGTTESSNPFVRAARITTDTAAKGLEGYRRATNWAMEQGDVIFSKEAYAHALAGYLKAHQVTAEQFSSAEWQSRNGTFVDKARQYAIKEAQESTFRDSNTLSSWISRIGRRRDTPKVARIAAEGLAPFRKTPANVLVRAEEYSPLGLINTAIDSIKAYRGAKGETTFADADITGADIVNSLSKTLTGTGLFLAGMALQNVGLLRGGDDDDDNQATFDDLTGHQAYSLELPNGVSYTLDWMTPAAMPLFMGAQLNELRQDGGIELKDLEKSLTSIAEPMLEMSMLSGVNSTIGDLKYSDDNFGQLAISLAVSYLTQGLTNSLVGQLERTSEDVRMSTYTDKNSAVPTWLQKTIGKSSAKMPGLDYHQIPYVDQWGEEEPSGDVLSRAIQNTLSPGYYSKVEMDDTEKELARLAEATGETSIYPKWIDKSFMVDGETKNLTAEEYTKYAKTTGQTRKSAVDALMKNSGYQKLSDENKVKAVQRAYEYANAKGKMAVSSYTPTGFAKGAMRSVLPIDSYILYTLTSDRDHSGSTDSTESAQTLQSMPGLTNSQRGTAWQEKNSTTKAEKNPFTGALSKAGVSPETAIKVLGKYRDLYRSGGKAKDKTTEFKDYLYSLGLTPDQMAVAGETFAFFMSIPAKW